MNEDRNLRPDTEWRDDKGRFAAGNPGRPTGSRNRVAVAAETILDDAALDVAQKCIELAKQGNMAAITAVLRLRIPPVRERTAHCPIELPALSTPKDGLAALRTIAEAAAAGEIDAERSRALIASVQAFLEAFKIVDIDERVRVLEAGREVARDII